MSEQKFTPGPWNAGRPDMSTLVDGVASKWIYAGKQYLAVASGRIKGEWDEVMANAYLIAAAPDLLAALKTAMEDRQCAQRCDGPHEDCPCWYCRAGAAIARATPPQPDGTVRT